MKAPEPDHDAVDAYIASFPKAVQEKLTSIRQSIRKVAPEAVEKVSWKMPAYYQEGVLVLFAAFKDHVSIFPGPEIIVTFENRLKGLHTSKGTIQFPLDKPLPVRLIETIVRHKAKENKKAKAS